MKLRFLPLLFTALPCMASSPLLPTPAKQVPSPQTCTLTPAATLCYEASLAPLAGYLTDYIAVQPTPGFASDNGIVLDLDPALGEEAYRLDITPQRIRITGGAYGGVFNGVQTLLQLLPAAVYAERQTLPLDVACVTIDDAPRYAYRGMMLDVARTWSDANRVKRQIDLLSHHKINKLHLHLTDDEGWRVEIKSHPELTEIGAWRGGDSPVRAVYGKWDEKYGGFYTQDELRDLVAYAAVRNVEIIPEIDLPGHSRNIASVRPEIRCNYPPDTVSTNGYDYRSAWCVAREENYALLTDILTELCAIFPSRYFHVGGDEVDMTQWKSCPDCQALMKRRGMTDPHQLEDLFMERMAKILADNGKLPGVWNEAVNGGGLDKSSLIYGWQDVNACLQSTAKGYRTVVMPGAYFYIDMRQSPHEDGHDWAAIFDASKTYSFDLSKAGFSPEQAGRIAGLEAAFFSEAYISHEPEKTDYLDYMCFPRMCSVAELAWHGNAEGWERFYSVLRGHYDRMSAMGIRFRLFPPTVDYTDGTFNVAVDDGSTIRYTDDGISEPTESSPRYTHPIRTKEPHKYRFRSFLKTGVSPVVAHKSYYRTISPAVKITTTMGESTQFPYTKAEEYKGLSRTRRACRMGDRIDYTFAEPVRCREIFIQTGNRQLPKTIVTTGYVEVSHDGAAFTRAGELEKGAFTLRTDKPVKALRVVSTCRDNGTPYVTIQPLQIKPIL